MTEHTSDTREPSRAEPAGVWLRTAGIPVAGINGRTTGRSRAVLPRPEAPKHRPRGLMWRRGRKAGDVPVLHPVDPLERMIWVRPHTLSIPAEAKRAKRRRMKLAGRTEVQEPVKAPWISSRLTPEETQRFSAGWAFARREATASLATWHRPPAPTFGARAAGQLSARPPVRRKVVTASLD